MLTKTVMIVVQMGYYGTPRIVQGTGRRVSDLANLDPHLWVHDKATGKMLAKVPLPQNATGSPITYMVGARQLIVFPVGGGPLIAGALAAPRQQGSGIMLRLLEAVAGAGLRASAPRRTSRTSAGSAGQRLPLTDRL